MTKNILILSSSPRRGGIRNGVTDILKGADYDT